MPVWVRTTLFTVLAPGAVTVLVPWLILRHGPGALPLDARIALGPLRHLGWALIAAGAGAYLRCAFDFTVIGRGTPIIIRSIHRDVSSPAGSTAASATRCTRGSA